MPHIFQSPCSAKRLDCDSLEIPVQQRDRPPPKPLVENGIVKLNDQAHNQDCNKSLLEEEPKRMPTLTKYWRFVRIDTGGKRRIEEMLDAKTFVHQYFSDHELTTLTDDAFQHRLLAILSDETKPEHVRSLAECSLRCFISNQIDHVCRQLVSQFGIAHGFTAEDLYSYVLTDSSPYPPANDEHPPSLISDILQSYRTEKGTLNSWAIRRVRHHKELNAQLLEYGVYLVSDWAILNDTKPNQVQRIFTEFYTLSETETLQACAVLSAYHAVYRSDRIQQRLEGKGSRKCEAPSDDQWEKIWALLRTESCFATTNLTKKETQRRVQNLAKRLRDYRIYVRVKHLDTDSLDQPEIAAIADKTLVSQTPEIDDDEPNTQDQFLTQYRPLFEQALDQALAIALDTRVAKLRKRKPPVDHHYLKAMQLYYCQGMAMKDITRHVALEKQYQVSRLMDLKGFHNQVRGEMLCQLRDRVTDLAQFFINPDQLKGLGQTIENALDSQIDTLISDADPNLNNLFAYRLCRHLDTRSF